MVFTLGAIETWEHVLDYCYNKFGSTTFNHWTEATEAAFQKFMANPSTTKSA